MPVAEPTAAASVASHSVAVAEAKSRDDPLLQSGEKDSEHTAPRRRTQMSDTSGVDSGDARKAASRVVWSDDEEEGEKSVVPAAAASSGGRRAMSLDAIRAICKSRADLYDSAELNEKLFLSFGGFDAIDALEHFPELKSLWLENNLLTTLTPPPPSQGLAPLLALRCLYLQNNQLTSLAGVEALSGSLVLLNVSSNALTSLDGVASLTRLQVLDAHDNQISDVSEIARMTELRYLHTVDLSQNRIVADVADTNDDAITAADQPLPGIFGLLTGLRALKVLYLKQNPVVESTTQYRRLLSSTLPTLSFLDDRPVSALDRACAVAWRSGGTARERDVRTLSLAERREKEERNMRAWMAQKEARVKQLADLRASEAEQAAANAAAAAAANASTTDDADAPPPSSDPHLVRRIYHATSAPIPASPFHGEVASVAYSSWAVRQTAIEEEDAANQARLRREKEASEAASAAAAAEAAEVAAAAAAQAAQAEADSAAAAAASEPLPTSSYLAADDADEPEISAMKRMLHDVLRSTASLRAPGGASVKRSHNAGVSEAALLQEDEVEAAANEAAQAAQAAAAELIVPNLVAEAARPTPVAATKEDETVTETEVELDTADAAPNGFSILESQTIAQIYAETTARLPTVDLNEEEDDDDDDDNDEDEDDASEDEAGAAVSPDVLAEGGAEDVTSPSTGGSARRSTGSSNGSARKMPRILGFGPDDGHLINRPFLGGGGGSVATTSDDVDDDWSRSAATNTNTHSTAGGATRSTSLADLLASRRAARLGPSSSTSTGSSATRRTKRATTTTSAHGDLDGPSSSATGVTAETLLAAFIQAQSSPQPPAAAVAGDEVSTNGVDSTTLDRDAARQMQSAVVAAAQAALEQQREEGSDSDESDDSGSDTDDSGVPIDPRAVALEARRAARQQQQQQQRR